MTGPPADFMRKAQHGVIGFYCAAGDFSRADRQLRSYDVRGADVQDLIAVLVLTRAYRDNLRSRKRFRARIDEEMRKRFSKGEIKELIGGIE